MKELLIEKYEVPTEVDKDGTKIWKNRYGEIHRSNNKPAIIYKDGWKEYYKNGKKYQPVKTFENACRMLKLNPNALPTVSFLPVIHQKSIIAHYKLIIIAEALNQGWTPDWENAGQQKWYPWFDVGSGFGCSYADCGYSDAYSCVGSRFCFKTEELAECAGRQFENLYEEYLIIEDESIITPKGRGF